MNVTALLLGCPALTIPLLEDEGLPLGLQLLAGSDRDAALFGAASWMLGDAFERRDLIDRLRKHPLYRALRVDKIICAALEATLEAYARETAKDEIPVFKMLAASSEIINERARSFKTKLEDVFDSEGEMTVDVIPGNSAVGGGAAPDVAPDTALVALTHKKHSDHELERALRLSYPPVIARIVNGQVVLDLRTVSESEEEELIGILNEIN